jgi:hypothetical protein
MGVLIAYSSSAHRNLDLLPTREVPDRTVTRACFSCHLRLLTVSPAPHNHGGPWCPAGPGPSGPGETPGGGPPGRDKRCRGAHKHPDRAAYREDRVRKRSQSPPPATTRSWPHGPGSPHTYAQGMLQRASGQTLLSLPPHVYVTHRGDATHGCSLIAYGCQDRLLSGLLLGVRPDVDPPARQPGREAGILSLLADGERELVVRDGDPGRPGAHVHDLHLADPGR